MNDISYLTIKGHRQDMLRVVALFPALNSDYPTLKFIAHSPSLLVGKLIP